MSRDLFDCDGELWSETRKFSKFEAWIDLIQIAAFKSYRRCVEGRYVTVERGQVLASLRFLAKRWQWTISTSRRFLTHLVESGSITALPRNGSWSIYAIENYDTYQAPWNSHGTEDETPTEFRRKSAGTNENTGNTGKRTKKQEEAIARSRKTAAASEPAPSLFDEEPGEEPGPRELPPAVEVAAWIPIIGTPGSTQASRKDSAGAFEVGVPAALVSEWAPAYPAVNIPVQLAAARAWCLANPTKRKTARGVLAFLVKWLSREQNSGGRSSGRAATDSHAPAEAVETVVVQRDPDDPALVLFFEAFDWWVKFLPPGEKQAGPIPTRRRLAAYQRASSPVGEGGFGLTQAKILDALMGWLFDPTKWWIAESQRHSFETLLGKLENIERFLAWNEAEKIYSVEVANEYAARMRGLDPSLPAAYA